MQASLYTYTYRYPTPFPDERTTVMQGHLPTTPHLVVLPWGTSDHREEPRPFMTSRPEEALFPETHLGPQDDNACTKGILWDPINPQIYSRWQKEAI